MKVTEDVLIKWSIRCSVAWVTAVVLFTLFSFCAMSGDRHPSHMRLNEVGDFVAGVTAPLAFLWFFVTVWLQKESLADAAAQARKTEENTFKLALFDKRLRVRQQFEEAAHFLESANPSAHKKGIHLLAGAADTAEFIFSELVTGTLSEVLEKARQARNLDRKSDQLQGQQNRTPEDEQALTAAIDKRHQIAAWMVERLTPAHLNQMFGPYLKMPEPSDTV